MKPVAFLCILLAVASAQNWVNPVNGTWDTIAGWSAGLPTQSATIAAAGEFAVTVNSAVTLLGSLTLGGTGSTPTLFINATTFTVPTLNFLSGTIEIFNGTVIVGTEVVVNTTATATLSIAYGSLKSILGGVKVVKGKLRMLVQSATLNDTYNIASGAELDLIGTYSTASCKFSGDGSVALSGTLNIDNNGICNVETNTFVLGGASINATAQSVVKFAKMAVKGYTTSTIQAAQVLVGQLNITETPLILTESATLTVQGSLTASSNNANAAVIAGGAVTVRGSTFIDQGGLILRGTIYMSNVTIASTATLLVQQSTLYGATISSMGTVLLDRVTTGLNATTDTVTIVGGAVYTNSTITAQAGVTTLRDVTFNGSVAIQAGAAVVIDQADLVATKINNTGSLVIMNAVNFAQDVYYIATSASASFKNNGTVSSSDDSIFHFSGTGNVEGSYNAGAVSIEGQFATSADVNVDGAIRVVGGILVAAQGRVNSTGDIIVTNAAALIAYTNATAGNITTSANLIINATSTVIVQSSLKVGASLQVGAQSTLNITRGIAQSATFAMDTTAKYIVSVFSSTTSRVLNVAGNASLAGSLEVDIDGSFTFNAGQSAVVINYGAHTGTFGSFSLKRSPDTITYGDKNATVTRGTDGSSTSTSMDSSAFRAEMGLLAFFVLSLLF